MTTPRDDVVRDTDLLSSHAVRRMRERRISWQDIQQAMADENALVHRREHSTVFYSRNTGLILVFPAGDVAAASYRLITVYRARKRQIKRGFSR